MGRPNDRSCAIYGEDVEEMCDKKDGLLRETSSRPPRREIRSPIEPAALRDRTVGVFDRGEVRRRKEARFAPFNPAVPKFLKLLLPSDILEILTPPPSPSVKI